MLKNTEIRAPFAAMIIRRNINQDETLFTADEIATVFGVESVEISVHLAPANWSLLPEPVEDAEVTLLHVLPLKKATGDRTQGERLLEEASKIMGISPVSRKVRR